METFNRAADTLKTSLWGDGTNGQSEVHKSMIDDSVTETKFNGRTESDPDADGSYKPEKHNTQNRPEGPISTGGYPQGPNVTGDHEFNSKPFSNSNEPNTSFGGSGSGVQPSVAADPSYGQQDTQKHQGGDRPNAEPDDSSNLSGNSGDPFNSTGSGSSGESESSGTMPVSMGGMKLPDSENETKGEGTGTLYEKSTGLACDGGDFDATRPGAAREAARLMDEKGVKHGDSETNQPEPSKEKKWYGVDHSGFGGHGSHQNKRPSVSKSIDESSTSEADGHTDGPTEKKGLVSKIKDKLHHSSSE